MKHLEAAIKLLADRGILDYIIPQDATMLDLYEWLDKEDATASELLIDVHNGLRKRLDDADLQEALDRFLASLRMGQGWQADQHRNNLAKAAHALGLKTPISF